MPFCPSLRFTKIWRNCGTNNVPPLVQIIVGFYSVLCSGKLHSYTEHLWAALPNQLFDNSAPSVRGVPMSGTQLGYKLYLIWNLQGAYLGYISELNGRYSKTIFFQGFLLFWGKRGNVTLLSSPGFRSAFHVQNTFSNLKIPVQGRALFLDYLWVFQVVFVGDIDITDTCN